MSLFIESVDACHVCVWPFHSLATILLVMKGATRGAARGAVTGAVGECFLVIARVALRGVCVLLTHACIAFHKTCHSVGAIRGDAAQGAKAGAAGGAVGGAMGGLGQHRRARRRARRGF